MDETIANIRSSVIEGRAQTPRFRQRQLAALHAILTKLKNDILKAIIDDTHETHADAEAQYYLALYALKSIYLQLDPLKMIETEYSVSKGQSRPDRRIPYGYAHIMPSQTSSFYSTIVPVSAAIAAGNCVTIELAQNLNQVHALLRKVLSTALDRLTFAVMDKNPFDTDFQTQYCVTLDGQAKEGAISTSSAVSTPLSTVAAIVDRSADLQNAARDCVSARFSFGGKAVYAPDVVLVNEYSVKAFCTAVTEAALSYLTSNVDTQMNGSLESPKFGRKTQQDPSEALKTQLDEAGAVTLASGSRGTVALLPAASRHSSLLTSKTTEPLLLIHPISSLDDAIDFLNSTTSQPLLAAHIFAAPDSARYLSQFVNASVSFINSIPAELLVGPPAPDGFTISVSPRYTTDMFSKPHPEFVKHTSLTADVKAVLDDDGTRTTKQQLGKIHNVAPPAIKEGTGPPVGFFEQGLFVGGALVLSTIIVTSAVTIRYAAPTLVARLRR